MALNMFHLLRELGSPGCFQVLIWITLLTTELSVAFNNLNIVFYGYGAISHCIDVNIGNISMEAKTDNTSSKAGPDNVTFQLEKLHDENESSIYYHLYPGEWTIVAEVNYENNQYSY